MSDNLKLYWESFVNSQIDSYDRSCWLELFIFEYFKHVTDDKPYDTRSFCHQSTISTLLSCELLHCIHGLCVQSSDSLSYLNRSPSKPTSSNEDQGNLLYSEHFKSVEQKSSRSDKLVQFYHKTSDYSSDEVPSQDLNKDGVSTLNESDLKQLYALKNCLLGGLAGRILATLYCIGLEGISCGLELASLLVNLFPTVPWNEQKLQIKHQFNLPNISKPNLDIVIRSISMENERRISRKGHKPLCAHGHDIEEVSDTESINNKISRPIALKINLDPMDFEYFTSVVRSDDESRFNDPNFSPIKKQKVKRKSIPRQFMNEEFNEFLSKRLNVYQLSEIIVHLLSNLCQHEIMKCQIIENTVAIQSLNFSVDNLLGLRYDEKIFEDFERIQIKLSLIRLYFAAWDIIPAKFCDLRFFESGNIFFQLAAVLRDAVEKNEPLFQNDNVFFNLKIDLVYGVLFALLLLLHNFITRKSKHNMRELNMHIEYITNHENKHVIKSAVNMVFVNKAPRSLSKSIVELIAKSMLNLKTVQNYLSHKSECAKKKHRHCKYEMSNHHIITGKHNNEFIHNCNIRNMFSLLTNMLEIANYDLNVQILKIIQNIKACCCIKPEVLIKILTDLLKTEPGLTNLCFLVIEKLIYKEIHNKCCFCQEFWIKESLTESNEKCIKIYQELLERKCKLIFNGTIRHISKISNIVPNTNSKYLLMELLLPTFKKQTKHFIENKSDYNKSLTLSCLNAIIESTINNQHTRVLIEQDIMTDISKLIFVSQFTHPCCIILELAVKCIKSSHVKSDMQLHETHCQYVLTQVLISLNAKVISCMKHMLPKAFIDEYIDLQCTSQHNSEDINHDSSFNNDDLNLSNPIEVFKMATDVWKCAGNVCNHFRNVCNCLERHGILFDGIKIISGALYIIINSNVKKVDKETCLTRQLCSMFEAVLSMQIALPIDQVIEEITQLSLSNIRDIILNRNKNKMCTQDDNVLKDILGSLVKCTTNQNQFDREKYYSTHSHQVSDPISVDFSEDEYQSANEGYEGDSDYPCDTRSSDATQCHWWNQSMVSHGWNRQGSGASGSGLGLTHMGLYRLIIELLVDVCDKYLESNEEPAAVIIDCIKKLSHYKINSYHTIIILKGFYKVLQKNDEKLQDLQQSILSLIHNLDSRTSLSLYFGLFKCKDPPLTVLLEPLKRYSEGVTEPPMFQTFPKLSDSDDSNTYFSAIIPHLLNKPFSQGFSISMWIKLEGNRATISSVKTKINAADNLVVDPYKCNVPKNLETKKNNIYHVVSYGLKNCMLEIWTVPGQGLITFRLTNDKYTTGNEANDINSIIIPTRCWHHLAINVYPKDNCVQVATYSHIIKYTVLLPYPSGKASYKPSDNENLHPCVSIGHQVSKKEILNDNRNPSETDIKETHLNEIFKKPSFSLTNMLIYDAPVIDDNNLLDLIGLGPECSDLAGLELGNLIINPLHIFNHPNVNLQNNNEISSHVISNNMKKLRDHLSIVYNTNRHDCIMVYQDETIPMGLIIGTLFPPPPAMRPSMQAHRKQPPILLVDNKKKCNDCSGANISVDTDSSLSDDMIIKTFIVLDNEESKLTKESEIDKENVNLENKVVDNTLKNKEKQAEDIRKKDKYIPIDNLYDEAIKNSSKLSLDISLNSKSNIAHAVILNGGVGCVLMFFARVVELSPCPVNQASALHFVLKMCHSNTELYSEFVRLDGLHLIHNVISTDKCTPSLYMLKAILNTACSTPVLLNQTGSQQFKVIQSSKSIIVYPELMISVIRYYNCWNKKLEPPESCNILDTLLLVILVLTRETHTHQDINTAQLTRINTVKALIVLCKDMCLNKTSALGDSSTSLIVNILRSLVGCPPKIEVLGEIMQLLLLLHRDRDTFVTHSRSKFYFLLTETAPFKPKSKNILYPSRKISKKQYAKYKRQKLNNGNNKIAEISVDVENSNKNEDMNVRLDNDLQIIHKKYETKNWSYTEDKSMNKKPGKNFTQPIDAKKLNKALTNLQIRQSGKKDKKYGRRKNAKNRNVSDTNFNKLTTPIDRSKSGTSSNQTEIDTQQMIDGYVIIDSADVPNQVEKHNLESCEKDTIPSRSSLDRLFLWSNSCGDLDTYDMNQDSVPRTFVDETSVSGSSAVESSVSEMNDWPNWLSEGLLLLVTDLISVLPDSLVSEVFENYVRPEPLLVMANNPNESVRTAIVKLLTAYISRASVTTLERMCQQQYWYLLANQIASSQANDTLINAVAGVFTGSHLPLEEQIYLPPPLVVPTFATPLIISVLYRTLHDIALCHNYICFLRHVFNKYPDCHNHMLSNFIVEKLLKCLVKVTKSRPENTDIIGFNELDIIIQDIHIFLVTIANKVILMSSAQYLNIICDMLNQLIYLENNFTENEYTLVVLRESRAAVLRGLLDIIEEKLQGQTGLGLKSTSSYLASVLTSGLNNVHLKNKAIDGALPKNEVNARFSHVFKWAVNFITLGEPQYNPGEIEINLFQRLLQIVLRGYSDSRERSAMSCDLISWALNPIRTGAVIVHTMHGLIGLSNTKDFIRRLGMYTEGFVTELQQFSLHICHMPNHKLSKLEHSICEQFVHDIGVTDKTHAYNNITATEMIEVSEIMRREQIEIAGESVSRSVHKFEHLCQQLIDSAMTMTRDVSEEQNMTRGLHIAHIRNGNQGKNYISYTQKLSENHIDFNCVTYVKWWDVLIESFTNERSQWHFNETYPTSWEIDPTECPGRMRVRTRRTQLAIQPRFFKEEHKSKLNVLSHTPPFSFLLNSTGNLLSGKRAHYTSNCIVIEPTGEIKGEIVVGSTALYLMHDDHSIKPICCSFDDITEICPRRYQLMDTGVEIFLVTGRTVLVSLITDTNRNQLLKVLDEFEMINRVGSQSFNQILQKWRDHDMTNFEYLIALNTLCGRSYNDLMQYLVFPWILADYESEVLDLNSLSSYRDLKKPIAVQGKEMEQHYINNFNYLKQSFIDNPNRMFKDPYHYGSHYSNSGTVLHFLVRLPPYTSLFLNYQDNNFDLPDRTFHSINTTWRLASKDSPTDVKELIPEFYYLPEFLLNTEGFNFGTRQTGLLVDDVNLPTWCDSPRTFILVLRQALENAIVRENLPHWLDLVFGYKQTGKHAIDAINVFHPATYYGSEPIQISDPVELLAWTTMVRTYGQMPVQLLKTPHPASHNIVHNAFPQPNVISSVVGLNWGNYVGSRASPDPILIYTHQFDQPINELIPLENNEIVGLAENSSYLSIKGIGMCVLHFGHFDNVARVVYQKEPHNPQPVFTVSKVDPITRCITAPDFNQIWLGHESGLITVHRYNTHTNSNVKTKDIKPDSMTHMMIKYNPVNLTRKVTLVAHTDSITDICICPGFKIAVSVSLDGTAVIWDLNELTYVRSIYSESPNEIITYVTISPTLGDIVTVRADIEKGNYQLNNAEPTIKYESYNTYDSDSTKRCLLQLHTINAMKVSEIVINEIITALHYSSAPEGISVNIIAVGFKYGNIRLYSSWDLKLVREIRCYVDSPVISIAYSSDSQHLFVSTKQGHLFIWKNPSGHGKPYKFHNLTNLS